MHRKGGWVSDKGLWTDVAQLSEEREVDTERASTAELPGNEMAGPLARVGDCRGVSPTCSPLVRLLAAPEELAWHPLSTCMYHGEA